MPYSYNWRDAFNLAFDGKRQKLEEHIRVFYDEHLIPALKSKTKSDVEAHEIASAVIAKFWEKFYIGQSPLPDNVNGYIYVMANNAFLHHCHVKKRISDKLSFFDTERMREVMDKGMAVEKDWGVNDEQFRLYQVLDRVLDEIGHRCKELLDKNIVQRMTIREIAPLMEFPTENAATQKKASCMKKLRKILFQRIRK